MSRTTRCLVIDLSDRHLAQREIQCEHFGGWEIHLQALRPLWQQDPTALALSTGPLVGSGAPGSVTLYWCFLAGGEWMIVPMSGRFGAYLRYSGIDHLILLGRPRHAVDISLLDGVGKLKLAPPLKTDDDIFQRVVQNLDDPNGVVLSCNGECVMEDGYFKLANPEIARRFQEKRIRSLATSSHGKLPIADSDAFLQTCIALYGSYRSPQNNLFPVPYLTLCGEARNEGDANAMCADAKPICYGKERAALELFAMSLLGLRKEDCLPQPPIPWAAELMTSYTGRPWHEEDMIKAACHVGELMERGMRHGDND